MMKKNHAYIGLLLTIFAILVWGNAHVETDKWEKSFERQDTRPYGSHVLYELLPQLFDGHKVVPSIIPPYVLLSDSIYENTNYVFVTDEFAPDRTETAELLAFVSRGNVVFVSTESFYGDLSDSLGVWTELNLELIDEMEDIPGEEGEAEDDKPFFVQPPDYQNEEANRINFLNKSLFQEQGYFYNNELLITELSVEHDSLLSSGVKHTFLGKFEGQGHNFMRVDYGAGYFLISSVPLAFTNYNVLVEENGISGAEYAYRALSYLPAQATIWDRYYKPGNTKESTPLKFVMASPALRFAYYVFLGGMILFMFVRARRKQRIIPLLTPKSNRTVEFARTIGRLYFNQADHRDLAGKLREQFKHYVQHQLHLPLSETTGFPIDKIAARSGVPEGEVTTLVAYLDQVQEKNNIDAEMLRKLAGTLDLFYSRSKR